MVNNARGQKGCRTLTLAPIMQVHNCMAMYQAGLSSDRFGSLCVKADLGRNHCVHNTFHATRCYDVIKAKLNSIFKLAMVSLCDFLGVHLNSVSSGKGHTENVIEIEISWKSRSCLENEFLKTIPERTISSFAS
jgi:hypothetical protein